MVQFTNSKMIKLAIIAAAPSDKEEEKKKKRKKNFPLVPVENRSRLFPNEAV